jgi:hypothetical protein
MPEWLAIASFFVALVALGRALAWIIDGNQ